MEEESENLKVEINVTLSSLDEGQKIDLEVSLSQCQSLFGISLQDSTNLSKGTIDEAGTTRRRKPTCVL